MQGFAAIDFEEYGMEYPEYKFYCTLAASRRCLDIPSHQLHFSATTCGFNMENRHNALVDADEVNKYLSFFGRN